MNDNQIKALITFNTEMIKVYSAIVIVTIGGTISLILSKAHHAIHYILGFFGMLISLTFIILAIFAYKQTKKLIKNSNHNV